MSRWLLSLTDPWCGSPEELLRLVGGKGTSLRQLRASGYDVPPAFTITTEAVRDYRRSQGVWPAGLREEVAAELRRLEEAVGRRWGGGPIPLTVAVRSGAAESYPGLMQTVLDCGWTEELAAAADSDLGWREFARFLAGLLPAAGLTSSITLVPQGQDRAHWRGIAAELLSRVRQAFGDVTDEPMAWLWLAIEVVAASADRITSASEGGAGDDPSAGRTAPSAGKIDVPDLAGPVTAITVQAMFRAEVSGVLCSRDPLAPESGRMWLEMVRGEGLSLMAGRVPPVISHLMRPSVDDAEPTPDAVGGDVGALALLTPRQQSRLRSLAVDLERQFGGPVEVEWGAAGDRLVVFQCRSAMMAASPVEREVKRLRAWAAQGRRWWVRHQVGEELGTPTPLTWSLWQRFLSPAGGLGALYRRLGYVPRPSPDGAGCFALIAGRVYVDPDRWVELICRGYPWRHDPAELRRRPEHVHEPPTCFDPQRLDPWFLITWPHLVWVLVRAGWRRHRLTRTAAEEFVHRTVPRFQRELDRWRADLRAPSSWPERISQAEGVRIWLFEAQAPRLMLPGWLGVQAWQDVRAALRRRFGPTRADMIATQLLMVVDRGARSVDSTEKIDAAAEDWTRATTSWELRPLLPLQPGDAEELDVLPAPAAAPALEEQLSSADRRALGRSFERKLQSVFSLLPLREQGRRCLRAGYRLLRELLAVAAEGSGLGEDVSFLTWDELLRLSVAPVSRRELAERQAAWRYWQRHVPPPVIDGGASAPFAETGPPSSGTEWEVVALSAGLVEGPVWHATDAGEASPAGCVVVAEVADSAAVLRWQGAAAIVVEQGGRLSHAAATARQIGLPLVVLPGAVRVLPAGGRVRVDADEGRLWRLSAGDLARQG